MPSAIQRSDLNTILIDHVGIDSTSVASDSSLSDIGVDSIGLIELEKVLLVEYGVELPDTAAAMSADEVVAFLNDAVPETALTAGRTDNSINIDAPREFVWRMTNDVRTWPGLFTEYDSVEVLDETGDTVRFRLTMKPDPDGSVWSWVSERTSSPADWKVSAHRVETGPFEFMHIHWDYIEAGGSTLMRWRQEFRAKPDAPFDDAAITQRIDSNTKIQMAVIKGKVEHAAGTA